MVLPHVRGPGGLARLADLAQLRAVDWQATVWLNGVKLGEHRGGYTPFSFELSDALATGAEQEIVVRVWDLTDIGSSAARQAGQRASGIWYTAVTGIWQTVWVEPVGPVSIDRLWLEPDIDNGRLIVKAVLHGNPAGVQLRAWRARWRAAGRPSLRPCRRRPRIAHPQTETLVARVTASIRSRGRRSRGNQTLDSAESHFAMRKIALKRDERGYQMLALNNEILFQMGPLVTKDGGRTVSTRPTDEALIYDIKVTKDLGFNMARAST
ncbi:MAG: hypothetical protein R2748_33320 [Bryobacterales bacterium]